MRTGRRKMLINDSFIHLNYIYNSNYKAYIQTKLTITDNTRIELVVRIPKYTEEEINKDNFFAVGFTMRADPNYIVVGNVQSNMIYLWTSKQQGNLTTWNDIKSKFVLNMKKKTISWNNAVGNIMMVAGGVIAFGNIWNIYSLKATDRSYYYGMKVWNGDNLVGNFIPVKRKLDGMIGMYDTIGDEFYTSPNGVAFTGG